MDQLKESYLFSPEILERGFGYFKDGRARIVFRDRTTVKGIVTGKKKYVVELVYRNDRLFSATCTCPYPKGYCKHIAAALYQYAENQTTADIDSYKRFLESFSGLLQAHTTEAPDALLSECNRFYLRYLPVLTYAEQAKALYQYALQTAQLLSEEDAPSIACHLMDLLRNVSFPKEALEPFVTSVFSNPVPLGKTYLTVLKKLLEAPEFSETTQSALTSQIKITGIDFMMQRLLGELLRENFIFGEPLYSALLTKPDTVRPYLTGIARTCMKRNYLSALKQISVHYRDLLPIALVRDIQMLFYNQQDLPGARSLGDYLLKQIHTFDYYLFYRSLWDEASLESKIQYALQIAQTHKFSASVKLYESMPVQKSEFKQIPFKDLISLRTLIPDTLSSFVSETLSQRIEAMLEKRSPDPSVFEGLFALSLLDPARSLSLVEDERLEEKITTAEARGDYLRLLFRIGRLQIAGAFEYERSICTD